MRLAHEILDEVAAKTDAILLFHSLSGKDSIALLDMCYPRFGRIVCVFMYIVPNLRHLNKYIRYIRERYPKVEIVMTKHYALYNYLANGFMGCEREDVNRQWRLRDIDTFMRAKMGIEWSVYGFKQNDSLQRRLMLRGYYKEGIEWEMHKAYPLSSYSNKEVLAYIHEHHLKTPETYGDKTSRSIGTDITDAKYLGWLKENYPSDYEKVCELFPLCRTIV